MILHSENHQNEYKNTKIGQLLIEWRLKKANMEKGVDPGNLVPRRNQSWQKEFGQVNRTCQDEIG